MKKIMLFLSMIFAVSCFAADATATAPSKDSVILAAAEEQTEYNVILTDSGPNKIQVIKVVREINRLGLKETKDHVENTPYPVKEGISKDEADKIKRQLEDVGAKVEIK